MARTTKFKGGFKRTYDSTNNEMKVYGDGGFVAVEHSEIDKPLKIHSSVIAELVEQATEEQSAYYL